MKYRLNFEPIDETRFLIKKKTLHNSLTKQNTERGRIREVCISQFERSAY